jgi:large subunit ribosomal protein L10
MAKNKTHKIGIVEEYAKILEGNNTFFVVNPQGIPVNSITSLKKSAYQLESSYNIVKNTLFKIALKQNGLPETKIFDGQQRAVIFSSEKISETAKLISEFAKENEKLEIIGGMLNGVEISASEVKNLAELPSKDQLLGQLLSVMNGPARQLVTVMTGNIKEFLYLLNAINTKKS